MNPETQRISGPIPRVHIDARLAPGARLLLPEAAGHHLLRVLRLRPGAALVLFDGRGGEHGATISGVGRHGVTVDVGGWSETEREGALEIHLAQGVSSGERMDFTLQKAVELGVAGIEPVLTERSVVRLKAERAEKRHGHWTRICISACEQCGRNRVPPVRPPLELSSWLAELDGRADAFPLRVLLSPETNGSLRDLARPEGPILLLAGPEGGLTALERSDLLRRGFRAVRLGPRILRTETAAIAAMAAMHALWGDF